VSTSGGSPDKARRRWPRRLLSAILALDLTGWGYSQRKGPYDAGHLAAQVLGFLDALHLNRVRLVGHSTGAAAAALRSRLAAGVPRRGRAEHRPRGGRQAALPAPYRTTLLRLVVRSDGLIRRIYDANCGPCCPRLDRTGLEQWRRPLQVAGAENGSGT